MMNSAFLREEETEEIGPTRPWGEMAVVADPDDIDDGIADEDLPDTIPDPRPLPPFAEDAEPRNDPQAN